MDDILHEQCDYDPASGESYDFDRFITKILSSVYIFKRETLNPDRREIIFKIQMLFSLLISLFSDFNVHAGPVETAFIVDKLSYKSPNADELLVEDLTLKISQGAHLLVVGNTGTGKTSLLRVLNRLWEAHSGEKVVRA